LYEPVDSDQVLYYREAKDGQILEEGITEAGSMCSFIAAGTAYSTQGVPMIPMYIYYSMFGFQRVGDLVWAAADSRCRGFLVGGTAGRTTLNGEGLQHQDGHSHLIAAAFPTVRCYDPAYGYEIAVIVCDGLKRMYQDQEEWIYYVTVHNENYPMPAMPEGVEEGILAGMYKLSTTNPAGAKARVQLFGSGAILRETLRAQQILAEKYGVASDCWSVTSYKELRREAAECERWNLLHPDQGPKRSYLERQVAGLKGPFIAASDNVRLVAEQVAPWIPGGLYALGTDGMGRSDLRTRLRRHFEVDAESITLAALVQLARRGELPAAVAAKAVKELDLDPEKIDPVLA
jgi:pyruvate dehydrogenase E1 component